MSARSTIAALAALAATGCWPVIPGKADDYLLPETAMVTGALNMTTLVGGYWNDPAPQGLAFWGVLSEPRAVTGVEFWGVPGTCTRNPVALDSLLSGMRTDGTGTTRLVTGDTEVRTTWDSGSRLFVGDFESAAFVPFATYALAPSEFGDLGTIDIPEFIETTESSFVVTSHPQLADEAMPTVAGPEALAFTWDSDRQDYAVINVIAVSGGEILETVSCLVEDTGAFTVPPELFQNVAQTEYVAVVLGTITLNGGTATIGGVEQGYVTSSAFLVQGAFQYGTP